MRKWLNWIIPVCLGLVLISVVSLQLVGRFIPVAEPTLEKPLSRAIPDHFEGWNVTDLDLGPTESVVERSRDLLQLDDFVHRRYQRGDQSFSVYVAYWKPGKMPVRLVNQHTPDRCWTEVGWTCVDRKWNVPLKVGNRRLQEGQWGVYENGVFRSYTYFWHIVGGKALWYGGHRINTQSSLTSVWEDFRKFGLNVHREQFFVRIVSPEPMDVLWNTAVFQTVLGDLADLCLAQPETGDSLVVQ